MVNMGPPTRDEEFYFEDGSCILLVQDRLFNLHRGVLGENSFFFKQMFSLPQPATDQSGRSDDNPILCDDSVDDFRALCHLLYRNLSKPGPEPGTLDGPAILRTARIASLAHKYEFVGIEKWAHRVISGSSFDKNILSPEDASSVLEVAFECDWKDISTKLNTCLIRHITRDNDSTSLVTACRLRLLLNVAERLKHSSLQSLAYYGYLKAIDWTFTSMKREAGDETASSARLITEIPTTFYSLSALNDAQRTCLFRGFAQLSFLQVRLRVPPLFSHSNTGCSAQGHQDRCDKGIRDFWRQLFVECDACVGPLDILGSAQNFLLDAAQIPACVHLECMQALNQKAKQMEKQLTLELPKYFGLC